MQGLLIRKGQYNTADKVNNALCPDGNRRTVVITGEILFMSTLPGYIRVGEDKIPVVGQVYPFNRFDSLSSFADENEIDWRFVAWDDQSTASTIVKDRRAYLADNGL